jgi:NADPH:quinone reductase-like Zn-dependent oxidoreductase
MDAMDSVLEGVQSGAFQAVVGKTFPLARAGDAHDYLQSRKGIGKVILVC